jgi:hypothetical protein
MFNQFVFSSLHFTCGAISFRLFIFKKILKKISKLISKLPFHFKKLQYLLDFLYQASIL